MILYIVSIKDLAAQAFMQPAFVHSIGAAIREFADCVNNPDHQFGRHPDDYEMYELGLFDDGPGDVSGHQSPKLISQGKHVLITKS